MFSITNGKGFHITFENGWTVSVQWGWGNYCENTERPFKLMDYEDKQLNNRMGAEGCANAEVWAIAPEGKRNYPESPLGYQTPAKVLAFMQKVEKF